MDSWDAAEEDTSANTQTLSDTVSQTQFREKIQGGQQEQSMVTEPQGQKVFDGMFGSAKAHMFAVANSQKYL
jgi:hypothetical protein